MSTKWKANSLIQDWTWVINSISFKDNHYAKQASYYRVIRNSIVWPTENVIQQQAKQKSSSNAIDFGYNSYLIIATLII